MSLFKKELTERQKEILKSKDLPVEWSELNSVQKESIVAIEDMLQYLEKKYDKPFCYAGYKGESKIYGDEESLVAYAKGEDHETQKIIVTKTKNGYEDTYSWLMAMPKYKEKIQERIEDLLASYKYKVFASLSGVDVNGTVKAANAVVVVEEGEPDDMKKLLGDLVEKLKSLEGMKEVCLYSVVSNVTEGMDDFNYEKKMLHENLKASYFSGRLDRV